MGNRRVVRTKMVLPVRVWGVDSLGKPFNYLAHTLDITLKGARLGGVRSLLTLGDTIEVQCRHRKARFRVSWLGRPGHSSEHQIGVESLEPDKPIWGLDLIDREVPDSFETPPRENGENGPERRLKKRIPVTAAVEIRHAENEPALWADVADLSIDGCYVRCERPLRVGTRMKINIRLEGGEVEAGAVVRTCHPKIGMGVEFVDFSTPADADHFAETLERLTASKNGKPVISASKPDAAVVRRRLQGASQELIEIGELLKSVEVDPLVLREFRGALSHVRTTAWAVQRWLEIHDQRDDPFPVLNYINVERLRLATDACRTLASDIDALDPRLPKQELQDLLHAVEELFGRLSIMDFGKAEGEGKPGNGDVEPKRPRSVSSRSSRASASASDNA